MNYVLTGTAQDAAGNKATKTLTIQVSTVTPPFKTIWGSSPGGWGSTSAMVSALGIKAGNIVRAFGPGDLNGVPAGCHVLYSNDGGHSRGSDLDGATVGSAAYNSWLKELGALRDDAVHYVCWGHEEDIHSNDAVMLGRVYDGGRLVVDALNKTRKFPIKTVVITTGMPYDDATANGYKKWNLRNADVIGFDNYSRSHWTTIDAFAKSVGKPWGVGENGIKAGTPAVSEPDANVAAAMVQDHDAAVGKAEFYCYWPNSHQNIAGDNLTKSLAQLKVYIAA